MTHQDNILRLNDDCFYHILKFLPIIEWWPLRDTCTRLRTISEYCFERQAESFRLTSSFFSLEDVKGLLRSFGRFIKKLTINQNHFCRSEDCGELIPYLARYCRSLTDLKFVNLNATLTRVVYCGEFFSNLQRLVVDQWSDEQAFACCLADCATLKELELIRLSNIPGDSLAYRRIKSLKSFTMSSCDNVNYDALKRFLAKNWQLTNVKFFSLSFRNQHVSDHLMEYVGNTLPALDTLSVQFNIVFAPNMLPVTRLASLKKLEISLMYVANDVVSQLIANLAIHNNIEELHLALCRDESFQRLFPLKSLKILNFTETNQLDASICKKLATELPALSEIHIVECNGTTFDDIKQFVIHLPHLKRIVYNRVGQMLPSLTHEMFVSLVETRKVQRTKDALSIFLNHDDLSEIQNEFEWNGLSDTLARNAHVVRVLELEKEHRRAVFEYGSRFTIPPRYYQQLGKCGDLYN